MKAMILAAGRGARLKPLTDKKPKPLIAVGGKPLIEWHIEKLKAAGFRELVVNVSWLSEQLIAFLGDGSRWGLSIECSIELPNALETGGGIKRALPLLQNAKDPTAAFAVVNGDVWTDFDYAHLQRQPEALAHCILVDNPKHNAAGDFSLAKQAWLTAPKKQTYTFSGIGVYRPQLFAHTPAAAFPLAPLLRDAMARQLVTAEHYVGAWHDIGTVERLESLDAELRA